MDNKRTVGQYSLERKIGDGGMAEVWEARHLHLGTRVAIKFLLSRFASDPLLQERFLKEGQRQAQLKHPNIVEALDFLYIDGRAYLVMQYIDGGHLDSRLMPGMGPLPMNDVINISWGVLQALGYAHTNRFVHRDVKPSNVLIDRLNKVYLSDFGIALAMDDDARLTRTGMAVGTPHYMSPEQVKGLREVDPRSDIYSFGCVLYSMLTGGAPFDREGVTEWHIKNGHVNEPPPPVRGRNAAVTPALEHVVLKCMAKVPEGRYQSCNEVLWALHSALGGTGAYVAPAGAAAVPSPGPGLTHVEGRRVTSPVPAEQLRQAFQAQPYQTPARAPMAVPMKKSRRGLITAAIAAAVVVAALSLGVYAYVSHQQADVAFRMEGSTTIGDALAPALVRRFLEIEGAKDVELIAGKDKDKDLLTIRAVLPGESKTSEFTIRANGSGRAFDALKTHTADIGMASRRINPKESGALFDVFHEDMTTPATEKVLALDGVAMIVNLANSMTAISRQQLATIYSGAATNWSQLNGPNLPVKLYGRDKKSGTYGTFVDLVMGGKEGMLSPRVVVKENGEDIARAVANDPGGIGYVSLAQIQGVKALEISDGGETQALAPSVFTVATEDYILSRRLYFYVPPSVPDVARRFLAFAAGPEGQAVVARIGFVGLESEWESARVPSTAPPEYRAITEGKKRNKITFRFETGRADQLDNKGEADLDRVVRDLRQRGVGQVYLLGFADSRGTFAENLDLSKKRARTVGERLAHLGLRYDSDGFSSLMPVAANQASDGKWLEEGMRRNRRVELWASF